MGLSIKEEKSFFLSQPLERKIDRNDWCDYQLWKAKAFIDSLSRVATLQPSIVNAAWEGVSKC